MAEKFFSRLSYSFGNEDCRTEHEALKIQSGDRVVCVTASGDRPLHLLMADCAHVAAVDANPYQNHLFELKKTALAALDFDRYAGFLGTMPMQRRGELFDQIRDQLDPSSRGFWERHRHWIEAGILYQGSIEKWCKRLAVIMKGLRGYKIERLFAFDDLEEQREFVQQEWETKSWKRAFAIALNPMVTRLFIKDPGLYRHLGEGMRPSAYVYGRLHKSLHRTLAKQNLLASLTLRGFVGQEALPPYLTRLGAALIRGRLDRLSCHNQDVLTYLSTQPDRSIDCFSLSDIASYVDQAQFEKIVREIVRTAKSGARFCIREFMSQHKVPEDLAGHLKRDQAIEQRLEEEDRCFVYRFMIGKVHGI